MTRPRLAVVVAAVAVVAGSAVLALVLASGRDTGALSPTPDAAEQAALTAEPPQPAPVGERIYFVMTDRFANGDPTNDRGGLDGDRLVHGFDPTDIGFFHGGDLAGLTERLPYVKRLGMTALWITPPVVQRTVQGTSAGYHGYWGVDFTDVDPHLGDRDALRRLVDRAHELGLRVYLDAVVNHTGDVATYREAGAAGAFYVDLATKPYRDTEGRPFSPEAVAGSDAFPDIHPDTRSFPYEQVVAPADEGIKEPDWLDDPRNYHNRGDSTFSGESTLYGDIYGLDDLFTERPEVVEGWIDLWSGWIEDFGLDGFRLDTLQHVDPAFWRAFLPAMREAAGDAGLPEPALFGEVFDQAATASSVRRLGIDSVLDFAFRSTVVPYATGAGGGAELGALFEQDDLYTTPTTDAGSLATFLGNHDVGRVGFTVLQAALGDRSRALAADLLAHDALFLLRGAPIVMYGDEAGMTGGGDGTDKAARQDMFPTQVAAWQTEPRLGAAPIGGRPSYTLDHPISRRIQALAALLVEHPALASGAQITRVAGAPGAPGAFVASRIDADARTEYVVALGNEREPRTVTVPTSSPGARFAAVWPDTRTTAVADASGRLTITVPALGSLVLVADRPLPSAGPPRITLAPPELDEISGVVRLRADAPGRDPATVTFALRPEGDEQWVRLGTDRARPYRLFVEADQLPQGKRLAIVAIARSSSGSTSASAPLGVLLPTGQP